MNKRFGYDFDKRTKRLSIIGTLLLLLILAAIFILINSGYFRAWAISIFTAIVALFILSIPKYVKITPSVLEIHCLIEMTRIRIEDIVNVRRLTKKEMKRTFPVLASYGFFGYYGWYLDLSHWDFIKIYATEWDNFLELEDIYEQRYIISTRHADQIIELVRTYKEHNIN